MKLYCVIFWILLPVVLHAQQRDGEMKSNCFLSGRLYIDSNGFHGKTEVDTFYFENKQIRAIGSIAIDFENHRTGCRVGRWETFYENGRLKSIGNYELYFFLSCGANMLHVNYSFFKNGNWIYFYENGKIMALGDYKIDKVPKLDGISNQYCYNSSITSNWILNDRFGRLVEDRENIIKALGQSDDELFLYPMNAKEYFRHN